MCACSLLHALLMDEALHLQRKVSGNELDSEEHTKKEIDKHRAKNEMFQN